MHAIHLRNMLGATGRTHRQEQEDEEDEFLELFPEPIQFIEGLHINVMTTVTGMPATMILCR